MKLILASNSKDRKKILDNLHINYEVIPSNIEENFKNYINGFSENVKQM